MIVKDESLIRKVLDAIINYKDKYKVLGLFIVFILAVSFAGYQYKKGTDKKNDFERNLLELSKTVKVEKLYLDINLKNYQHILYERKQILEKAEVLDDEIGLPGLYSFNYVTGKLKHNTDRYNIKIRLKGDRLVHFENENKMSYRIKIKSDNTLFGMKNFSLHKPKHRNYIHEWIYHKFMNKEGIISLQYKFINLYINGEDKGIYALEEHFDKRLLERQARREGPIIKFNEGMGDFTNLTVDVFNEKKWTEDSLKLIQTSKAISLLTNLKEEKISLDQVFDIKKLAKFFAVCDVLGMNHGTLWKSIRFYYNPINSKLEPIAYDGHFGTIRAVDTPFSCEVGLMKNELPAIAYFTDWHKLIFNSKSNYNKVFYKYYITYLNTISKKKYIKDFFSEIQSELTNNLAIIYKDDFRLKDKINSYGPELFEFSFSKFFKRGRYIQQSLNKTQFNLDNNLKANNDEKDIYLLANKITKDSISFSVANMKFFPIEIIGFLKEDSLYKRKKHLIMQKGRGDFPKYKKIIFKKPEKFNLDSFSIAYSTLGLKSNNKEKITQWTIHDKNILENDLTRKNSNIKNKSFSSILDINENKKRIIIKERVVNLRDDLIIPKGYTVYCPPGVIINLYDNANILSYSNLQFIGNEESCITVQSVDRSGQGIILMNTQEKSTFKYVKFKKLSNPNKNGWNLTGAITCYKSNTSFEHCLFANNNSEDFLNIINTDSYMIDQSIFTNIKSDAFDSDFSKGYVYNTSFTNIGNDAIDLSGSYLEGSNISITKSNDKGISGGEASILKLSNLTITNSNIAIASKDETRLTCSNSIIDNCNIGVVSFQKKSEYGPAQIAVKNTFIKNTSTKYIVERGSILTIDDVVIKEYKDDLKKELY